MQNYNWRKMFDFVFAIVDHSSVVKYKYVNKLF